VQQFRMVRQKLLNRPLDQGLHRHAAQHGGKLEVALYFAFRNALPRVDQRVCEAVYSHALLTYSGKTRRAKDPRAGSQGGIRLSRLTCGDATGVNRRK
jgi:hypothetical protein